MAQSKRHWQRYVPPQAQGLYDPRNERDACGIGAVINISGEKSHQIVEYGKQVILNLHHRGAAGADEVTGDGAGILFQITDDFFRPAAEDAGFSLPKGKPFCVGNLFLPRDEALAGKCLETLEEALRFYELSVLGYRQVPCDNSCLGELALQAEPVIKQIYVGSGDLDEATFERMLYLARKRAENNVCKAFGDEAEDFYIVSLSCRTINYKGMFMAHQLFPYYPDLEDPRMTSALCLVHQRYSTNTFPNWKLAQPFRMVAHNGEINTVSGNSLRIRAREPHMESPLFGEHIEDLFPILQEEQSDSAQFDNVLELLTRAGRSTPHALMMMIPEAFGAAYHISTDKRAFYEYHSSIMEPWDGPAAMVFTDGRLVGGTLDRNGLRPARYVVTNDGLVVLGSEVGVIEFPPERIQEKGRLQPGKMFLVDTEEGRIVDDNEIKGKIARQKPYRRWLDKNRIELRGLFNPSQPVVTDPETLARQLRVFGYTREEINMIHIPMAVNGQEPVGSMGNDTPPAVLSDQSKPLFNYFKQLFAQVTNPPIDPLREGLVMSLMSFTGKQRNLLDETAEHCKQLKLPHPILTNEDMDRLRAVDREDFKVATIQALFKAEGDAGRNLRIGLDKLVDAAEQAIRAGASLIIISDRNSSDKMAPIPSLLATAAVHHGLQRRSLRAEAGLVVESGEPREVMHFCLLCGYGANAINPYLLFDVLDDIRRRGDLPEHLDGGTVIDNVISSIKKGILKTMSKMGISTLRSYQYAQLFQAIGLNRDVIDAYFPGTPSHISGVGLDDIARETLLRHTKAYSVAPGDLIHLDFGGDYHVRLDGERHLWNAETITQMQYAARYNDAKAYERFARAVNDQAKQLCTLRGLFEFIPGEPVPLEEVEPAVEIVKRFCTGAMSHGSISQEAHESMAIAMNRLGGMSNSGEGGEDSVRFQPMPNGDSKNSAIKQVASGRFGVTAYYLANAREIQIKMAQGAKPGEGGHLPGHKVTDAIATLRFSTPGVSLISPPPHHDIYSIEDLAQLIYDLKCANPKAKVSVKLVSKVGVGTVAAGVAKGNADEVLISGYDGGTGASPLSSIKHAGAPWELGLAETQQTLVLNGLRDRIRVQTDGQLRTGRDVVVAALLGAEQFGFGTAALVSLGCIMMRKCHHGTCPVGIATQDPRLRKKFAGDPAHLERYLLFVAEECRQIMAQLGFRTFEEMVGRSDRLSYRKALEHYKARGLDFTTLFHQPESECPRRRVRDQVNKLGEHLDWTILKDAGDTIDKGAAVQLSYPVRNQNRTVGAILSNKIVSTHGPDGLAEDTVQIDLSGSAGQSFGAFLAPGVTLKLVGDANDYLGKGLSGGKIIVQTPPGSSFQAHENIIVGNTLLYGATQGEVFINGLAGERFAVRNSGAIAIVEGVGDHGCEYMTGGKVVVIGKTGRNFAAGMSGGIAYVLDEHQLFDTLCNLDMVDLENVWQDEDKDFLRDRIEKHYQLTGSEQAKRLLDHWRSMVGRFVKVMPVDYRRALQRLRERESREGEYSPATEEVFKSN
jgi:glutamate synthase domain-containing protein 2/glutamate synthase domain-containing protein 1/glutamate synthase domain-containing protein 3